MHKIKKTYQSLADHINDKRFQSPFKQRQYIHQRNYQTFLKHIQKDDVVIDVGAGEGILSILMAKKGAKVIAVEISTPNLAAAQALAKKEHVQNKIIFIQGDAESIPIKSNTINYVVSSHVLEHLPNFNKGLKELARISKENVIFGVPTCLNLCALVMLGGGNYWQISFLSPLHLLIGLFKLIISIPTEGINEKYIGMDLPHIWRYPWRVINRINYAHLKLMEIEAVSIVPPYLLTYFPNLINIYKTIDSVCTLTPFKYLGYGTTFSLKKYPSRINSTNNSR